MSEKTQTEILSRRKLFSILGLATLALAAPPTVLMVSTAEAQAPSTPPRRRAERMPLRQPAGSNDVWRGVKRAPSGVWRDVKRAPSGARRGVKRARNDVKHGVAPTRQLRSSSVCSRNRSAVVAHWLEPAFAMRSKPLLTLSLHGSAGVLAGARRCRVACS